MPRLTTARNGIGRRWRRGDYAGDAETVAERLLGRLLVRVLDDGTLLAGRIVETEAYIGVMDRASHAFGGRRTARNEAMYASPGTAYVYFTYGMHFCFNVVCGKKGEPAATLVRALEPLAGEARMRRYRERGRGSKPLLKTDLCSGPGKLCQALAIDLRLNGVDMVSDARIHICDGVPEMDADSIDVLQTPRIGIGRSREWVSKPLRFICRGNPHVSR